MRCTIDARVFVASTRSDEPNYLLSREFPGKNLISLDLTLARRAAQIAVEHRLRGADAAYVAVADMFDATLISWDQEMLKRCPAAVATMTPESWCAAR